MGAKWAAPCDKPRVLKATQIWPRGSGPRSGPGTSVTIQLNVRNRFQEIQLVAVGSKFENIHLN